MKKGFILSIILCSCITVQQNDISQYNFSLYNTVSIFLLKNQNNYYFCIPVQYVGDYQIQSFELIKGSIIIGDYEIPIKRDEVNISVYLNEAADESANSNGEFKLIYRKENGQVSVSKMTEPLTAEKDPAFMFNHYYIFIEIILKKCEVMNIINEYEKNNVYSKYSIWYDLVIDNEEQNGSGMLDDFELHNGPMQEYVFYFPNLAFFRSKYL